MYIRKNYGFWMTFLWSRKPFIWGGIYSVSICLLVYFFKSKLAIPWQPIGVIGTAVAFYLGFKNNSSYDRTWEARKIWGGIVNSSRSFGVAVESFIRGEEAARVKKELIYRHIAWLTALRYQLRLSRSWEHSDIRLDKKYVGVMDENYFSLLYSELKGFISEEELRALNGKTNLAVQIMNTQAARLQEIRDLEYIDDFRHIELFNLITQFFIEQGRSERIKNFPFPRQYASTALWLTFVFSAFVPLGMLDVFKERDALMFILCPTFSSIIIWIFFLMEKIGDYSENPFEGSFNDVPITSISRGIEIDLREIINDTEIPKPIDSENGFLM